MATTNEPATRAFKSLSAIYDTLDGTDVREDLLASKYDLPEVYGIQNGISALMSDLEDILPGLEMMVNEGVE